MAEQNAATRANEAQQAAVTGEVTADAEDTRESLMERAGELNIEGRSSMNKDQLREAVNNAESAGVNRPREREPHEADPQATPARATDKNVENPNPRSSESGAAVTQQGGTPAGTGTAAGAAGAGGAGR